MHIHFIAIGGSAMHNLAIALHQKGYVVSGSDDEIFEPSRSRLEAHGLLPKKQGWFPEKFENKPDAVILGMHARTDNPELLEAQKLGLKIYSYPEFLYEQTKYKKRIVIGGSHGKTTTTSMIMHVFRHCNMKFDYMVGAKIEGFETMVGLSSDSEFAVFEGDEYLSSPIDPRPKFHHYKPHIAVITGIAWDHINVFPVFEHYVEQFEIFAKMIEPGGSLIYFEGDEHLQNIAARLQGNLDLLPYKTPPYSVDGQKTVLLHNGAEVDLQLFGEHNLQNLAAAYQVCIKTGIPETRFFEAIATFKGSARRLELIAERSNSTVFFDFAHSPSKLEATTKAVRQQFPERKLVAVMELHTFSSLKREFLPHYNGTMAYAHEAIVYFNPKTIEHKKLEPISGEEVAQAFGGNTKVYTNADQLFEYLENKKWDNANLLIMTSGNFSGKDIKAFAQKLVG
jgi:UDP-N-acetylmuramate: L-alanyl-gamma-D-glutamyl-meso-diaminopimelate ligase